MLTSAMGGLVIAFVCFLIAVLRRGAQREPRASWVGKESIESWTGVGLVAVCAFGITLIMNSLAENGFAGVAVGITVAVVGAVAAVKIVGHSAVRRSRRQS